MANNGWVGIDLDKTLATYNGWRGDDYVGTPIQPILDLVKRILANGHEVRIFTARANNKKSKKAIKQWLKDHDLPKLKVTRKKDEMCIAYIDDRAIGVKPNTGEFWCPQQEKYLEQLIKKGQ